MKALLFFISLEFIAIGGFTQTFSIAPGPTDSPVCPFAQRTYALHVSSGSLPNCTYTWTATNGVFPGHNNQSTFAGVNLTSIDVKWNDDHGGGTLKVEVGDCPGNSPNGELVSNNYSIATFFGQTFCTGWQRRCLGQCHV